MSRDHQKIYHRAWSQLGPPLRPPPDVIAAIEEQIKDRAGRALLLGVTPELADVTSDLVAVDRNFSMIANVWPGNTAHRRAIVGDWRNSNFASDAFLFCIGDGSLSFLTYPDETAALFHELTRVVKSGGRLVFRLYLAPDIAETILALQDAAMSGNINSFHAFKIRLGMSLAAQESKPHVGVANILDVFNSLFKNRDELVRATGWSREQIDTIDFYRESNVLFSFPTKAQLLSIVSKLFPTARLVASGSYEMSEFCPLLVADVP
jgi:SAM-dependent methyltransferase